MEDPLSRLPMDFNAICRTCLKNGIGMESIFVNYSDTILISDMIGECSSTKVQEMDGLPKLICRECLHKVTSLYEFKQQCEHSYKILKGYVSDFKTEHFNNVQIIDYKTEYKRNEFTQTENEKLLCCELCDSRFISETDLQIHRSNHKDDDELKCLKCKNIYTRNTNNKFITENIKYESSMEDDDDDRDNDENKPEPEIELTEFLEVKTEVSSESEDEATDDEEEEQSNSEEMFKCKKCDKSFPELKRLRIHQSRLHGSSTSYKCDVCDKSFARSDNLRIHMRRHTETYPHECPDCNRTFIRRDYLKRHKCKYNNKESKSFTDDDGSLENEEDKKNSESTKIEPQTSSEPNETSIEPTPSAPKTRRPVGPKKVFCEICQKGFTKQNHLNTHKKIHEPRDWICKSCKNVFPSREELREHKKTHANDRPFLCTECGMRFIRNDFLILHMRRHTGEKPFKCKYCDKGFIRPAAVAIHERYHTDEKPHLCTTCGKGFHRAYNLSVHIRVHTGERPYKCQHCEKTFVQSKDLKAHIQQHTGEHFKCDICNENFIHLYLMNQHKRNLHGIDIKSRIGRVKKFIKTAENEIIEKPPENNTNFKSELVPLPIPKPVIEGQPAPNLVGNEPDYAYWGIGLESRFRPHSPRFF